MLSHKMRRVEREISHFLCSVGKIRLRTSELGQSEVLGITVVALLGSRKRFMRPRIFVRRH